mmetsp:Transcript_36628/g.101152  ORF Transcript_36628/g.101152 Transcript_36628/m.101152 type:complete len:212 (+) Transcript_36628:2221-2856(+)
MHCSRVILEKRPLAKILAAREGHQDVVGRGLRDAFDRAGEYDVERVPWVALPYDAIARLELYDFGRAVQTLKIILVQLLQQIDALQRLEDRLGGVDRFTLLYVLKDPPRQRPQHSLVRLTNHTRLACDVVHEGQLSEGVAGRALLHERAEALDRVVRRRRLVHPFVDVELALGDGVKVVLRRANLLVALTDDDLALGAAGLHECVDGHLPL